MKGTRHAILRLILVGASLFPLSCRDRDPVAPPTGGPSLVPSYYTHDTSPPGCWGQNTCLLDDVAAPWIGQVTTMPNHYIEIFDAVTPTTRGGTFSAKYRMIAKSNGYVSYEGPPACWTRSTNANRPDGRVIIQGRNIDCSVAYFTFTSYAPLPVPTVVEFERPAQVSCLPNKWCDLTVRLKIDIPGSGWYVADETMIYVESASGSRWSMVDGSMSVSGTAIAWTFNRLFYPGPGSRIAVKYYPWGRNYSSDTVTIHLPFDGVSAQLALTADPAQIDSAGAPVTFTASAPGILQVLDWTWVPEDSTGAPGTSACSAGVNPCVTGVYETGRMDVTVRVDGQERIAWAAVTVPSAELLLDCSPTQAVRGDPIRCEARVLPAGAILDSVNWTFVSTGGEYEISADSVGLEWDGPMVVSGIVTVMAKVDGKRQTRLANIDVTARNWVGREVGMGIELGGQGELPPRPSAFKQLGQTDGILRFRQSQWLSTRIPSGPNARLYYVIDMPIYADVAVFINEAALSPSSAFMQAQTGPPYCTAAELSDLPQKIMNHEMLHADYYHTRTVELAGPAYEPLVASSDVGVLSRAADTRDSIHDQARQYSLSLDNDPGGAVVLTCDINWNY